MNLKSLLILLGMIIVAYSFSKLAQQDLKNSNRIFWVTF